MGRDPETGRWPIVFRKKMGIISEELKVPCGRCIGCRLDYARSWMIRCVHESKMHEENCFLTLTYNDERLETRCRIVDETDDDSYDYSLNRVDLTKFIKRLRGKIYEKYGKKIRYFACGEYGEQYQRPHYHIALFGWEPKDKVFWKEKEGVYLYKSEIVEKTWGNGYVVVGDITIESAAYIARYVVKKIVGIKANEHYDGREKEYTVMSRAKAIGKDFWELYKTDIKKLDQCVIEGRKIKVPKLYDKLHEMENPEEYMLKIKKRKEKAIQLSSVNTEERLLEKEKFQKLTLESKKRGYENGTL